MYYPFIRGRQFDLIALRELPIACYNDEAVLPIIEPVDITGRPLAGYRDMVNRGIPFILIANPQHGGVSERDVKRVLIDGIFENYDHIQIGYMITQNTTVDNIRRFCDTYQGRNISLIHYNTPLASTPIINFINRSTAISHNIFLNDNLSTRYINGITNTDALRITIRDGFHKAVNNAAYAANPVEHFHDLHLTYTDDGYDGFGDFCTIGEAYNPNGFTPLAVVIHLTHSDTDAVITNHFVSDDMADRQNAAGKFGQAVGKLNAFVTRTPTFINTAGSEGLQVHHRAGTYPGLPSIKKLSIMHHLEMMGELIRA